ncbi:hypothetical protein [Antarcticirhabdus aurantiaca]|uniref:Uncharacterized protein n=1 Tax=Antarcticirhabdus aurantiaca TaxID=2606717 RepID=A0ACD4NWC3_9HYPH|nr:hypothetical protein [Antarcticirhabdus aurantiaca]WAJ31071.1 hypothetical protein OXU80_13065 [Jeongeuplla avenae]
MKHSPRSRGPEPETIERRHDALLVLDVDEVVLEFIGPFDALLRENGARLHFESFRLTGNARSLATGEAIGGGVLEGFTQRIYAEQAQRQPVVRGAAEALARLAARADIVFLTAMTPSFYDARRALLDSAGLHFPMIATERSKGGVVDELMKARSGPAVFVDDLPPNLLAVHRSAPAARLVHLMAHEGFRPHLPPLPPGAFAARDWPHAEAMLAELLAGREPTMSEPEKAPDR